MARRRSKKTNKYIILITVLIIVVLVALIAILAWQGRLEGLIDDLSGIFFDNSSSDNNSTNGSGSSIDKGGASFPGASYGEINGETIAVHFVSVEQGDAIIIELPEDKYMVIDAGSGTSVSKDTKDDYYAYLDGVIDGETIDYLIATHPDADHVNMLSGILTEYEVKNIYYNEYSSASKTYSKFIEDAQSEEGATLILIDDGDDFTQTFSVGTCSLTIYSSGNDGFSKEGTTANEMSIMCLLSYGSRKILFTGDATDGTEEWFIEYTNDDTYDVDFLKVGHHGSAGSSSTAFLNYVNAEYGIICVDEEKNDYGHPTKEALDRLAEQEMTVYRTDTNGDIVLTIDSEGDYAFTFSKDS